ncbi:hypothetical protein [Silvimonas iriomotensis]|uniref:Dolichyl-phosphate-mannose-protein mannosyltransferase n=1 Tax=Silvimonas iriomotensis TaxID=449662 RepID=A0ABQ2PEJ2_9NEIS|nr:hypothetical protein [Silvimonas iriomotensis]GGP23733.1 hypothetical protein GCM10010970_37330 [Silvimonas iriomotensis]
MDQAEVASPAASQGPSPDAARQPGFAYAKSGRLFCVVTLLLTLLAITCTHALALRQAVNPFVWPIFARLLFVEDAFTLQAMLVVIVLGFIGLKRDASVWLDRSADWIGEHPGSFALGVSLVTAAVGRAVYMNHPFAMDEFTVLYQSQLFAHGQLAAKYPPGLLNWVIPYEFQNYFLLVNSSTGTVASAYWPGFALLLTPFALLDLGWLANPVIAGLISWVTVRFGTEIFKSARAAGLTALFLLLTPVFWADSISFYSMNAILLFNLLFAWGVWRGTTGSIFAAGMAGGLAICMHNPVPHILFALPWWVWLLRDRAWRKLLILGAGYLPLGLLLGLGWVLFRVGHFPAANGPATAQQHGSALATYLDSLSGVVHLPSITVLLARLGSTIKLWAWAWPGLIVLAIAGLRHMNQPVRLMAWSFGVTFAGFFLVPFDQGHGWGYRYVQYAFLALPLLAVAYVEARPVVEQTRLKSVVAVLLLGSLFIQLPLQMWQINRIISLDLAQLPTVAPDSKTVMFIRDNAGFYTQDLVQNDPFLRSNHVRLISHGDEADARFVTSLFPGSTLQQRNQVASLWIVPSKPQRSQP